MQSDRGQTSGQNAMENAVQHRGDGNWSPAHNKMQIIVPFGIRVVRHFLRLGGIIPNNSIELKSSASRNDEILRTSCNLMPSGPAALDKPDPRTEQMSCARIGVQRLRSIGRWSLIGKFSAGDGALKTSEYSNSTIGGVVVGE